MQIAADPTAKADRAKELSFRSSAYRGIIMDHWHAPLELLIMLAWNFMITFHACCLTGASIVSGPSPNRRPVSGPFTNVKLITKPGSRLFPKILRKKLAFGIHVRA